MSATNGTSDDIQFARFQQFLTNGFTARQEWLRKLLDPRRDLDDECGFPREINLQEYQRLYDREPVAARVVEVWPLECWQVQPSIYENEDAERLTPFEQAWQDLSLTLRGEQSWYQDDEGSPIWEALCQADILSRIGRFGVLLLGLDDGRPLSEPAAGFRESNTTPGTTLLPSTNVQPYHLTVNADETRGRRLLYLRAFAESDVTLSAYETNLTSPRYGQPSLYSINLAGNDYTQPGGSVNVHWSRVIHIAEGGTFHTPAMQAVFNNLYGLRKLYGGSPEMYWRGAFPGYALETHPQLGGDVEVNQTSLKDMMENWANGLQRYLTLMGMSVKSLAPQVVDPTPQINVQIEAVCIKLGIPKRIFMGSERGELASSQDEGAWNGRLHGRQCGYLTPRLIIPLVDRLIQVGVLPEPSGYSVWWPDLAAQSDAEKADVATKRTAALTQYVSAGADAVVPPLEFLTLILGFTDEEAQSILQAAAARLEETDDTGSPLLGLVGGITGMIEMFKMAKEGAVSEEQLKQLIILFFKVSPERADEIIADGLTPAAEKAGEESEPEPFGGQPARETNPFGEQS